MSKQKYLVIFLLLVGFLVIEISDFLVAGISDFRLLTVPLYGETLPEPPSNFNEENAGTEQNPYLIANLANLRWLSEHFYVWSGYYFLQTSNIDASETKEWNFRKGFSAIGGNLYGTLYEPFSGVYDGKGYVIKNLYINWFDKPDHIGLNSSCSTLFGMTVDATLKNIRLENINVYFNDLHVWHFGGLASIASGTTILNCSVTGNIFSVGEKFPDRLGGLVGSMQNSTIENSFFYGNINNPSELVSYGGLVGQLESSTVRYSYVSSFTELINIGGLIGKITSSVGESIPTIISNNFWDINMTGVSDPIGEIISEGISIEYNFGKTTIEMKQISTYTENGWNFDNIWNIDPAINDGYPFLKKTNANEYDLGDKIYQLARSIVYPNPVMVEEVTFKLYLSVGNVFFQPSKNMTETEISIYNIRGQLIKKSFDFQIKDGEHSFVWNKKDMNDREVASGVYFYRINSPQLNRLDSINAFTQTGKFLILK